MMMPVRSRHQQTKKGTGSQSVRPAGRLCDQKLIRVYFTCNVTLRQNDKDSQSW
jgi:hypothetical protein